MSSSTNVNTQISHNKQGDDERITAFIYQYGFNTVLNESLYTFIFNERYAGQKVVLLQISVAGEMLLEELKTLFTSTNNKFSK